MSIQVTEAFVEQFGTTFNHLAQQNQSRLETAVKKEASIKGTSKSINRLGLRTAARRTTRHGDTPLNDQAHSTRYVDLFDWEDGDMIDEQDKLRMLIDPTSDYMKAMIAGMNRAKDDVIIAALQGTARSSSGTVALPSSQQLGNGTDVLTKANIIACKELFRANEADEFAGEELYWVYGSAQMSDILADATITNMDYMTISMFQEGKVAQKWMGFTWIPSERLPLSSDNRSNFAFAKSGVCLGVGEDIRTELGKDPSKSFNWRAYCRMSLGAVRLEEEKVVEIICDE